jgi:NADH-dependent peroxiredoxin subunit F
LGKFERIGATNLCKEKEKNMLDNEMKEQLKGLFEPIKARLALQVYGKTHPKFEELLELLRGVCEASSHLTLEENDKVPEGSLAGLGFFVCKSDGSAKISFDGVPGGHEFSSFVLSILNSAGLGRMPDVSLQRQIQSIKGPIRLRTFVSLSCENCPDVVQTLNQFALVHSDFEHTMVDGDLAPDAVKKLAIGAVPAVFANDTLLVSGRTDVPSLIEKLVAHFGKSSSKEEPKLNSISDSLSEVQQKSETPKRFDVMVVGGGPAGVSAAIYSARKGLKTAIVAERLGGQVKDTKGIENLIATIYTEGPKLTDDMRKHLEHYDITLFEHRRLQEVSEGSVTLSTGEVLDFERMIFATGAKWRELNIPGEKEYLGRGVAFCPHCDGPLYKNKDIVVVGGGNSGVEAALDLAGICATVTVLEFASSFKADEVLLAKARLAPNVTLITNAQTKTILGNGTQVTSVRYLDRVKNEEIDLPVAGIFVQIGLLPNSQPLAGLVEMNSAGEVVVDAKCRTSRKGIYAAGDVTNVPFKQIVISMGEGAKAALTAFEDRMLGA